MRTNPVHFYVQRNSSFRSRNAVITFEIARLNKGDAFNLTAGIFAAPVKGIYNFYFSAVKDSSASYLRITLRVNGANVGRTYTDMHPGSRCRCRFLERLPAISCRRQSGLV